ncbi:uncharacterized protein LOC108629598 [Ceratina calcarata]|uniref:Uncharacterized protein LOC108629598 n=1 Tax=Ceratina calcarata TaxID=156304 RepID=A0AAJ7WEJ5_9HYME|nr:uncharacterized protein LOC108629598 [Ceratina calcarata]
MSLITTHSNSLFDVLLNCIQTIGRTVSNIIELLAPVGFIAAISYAFHRVHEYRCKRLANVELINTLRHERDSSFETFKRIREYSIISHKAMLCDLIRAAKKSYQTSYALKCIDIIVRCPQLINVKDFQQGFTPFHYICFYGHNSLIAFMLAKGADVSITTERGNTALCMAIYHFLDKPEDNDFSRLDMLKQAGSEFGLENEMYDAILQLAFESNHTKLIEWLISTSPYKISRSVSTS